MSAGSDNLLPACPPLPTPRGAIRPQSKASWALLSALPLLRGAVQLRALLWASAYLPVPKEQATGLFAKLQAHSAAAGRRKDKDSPRCCSTCNSLSLRDAEKRAQATSRSGFGCKHPLCWGCTNLNLLPPVLLLVFLQCQWKMTFFFHLKTKVLSWQEKLH